MSTSSQLKLAADLKIDVRAAVDVAHIGSIVAQVDTHSYSRRLRLLSVVVPLLALALCSCERFAGVGGVFSVGVSCVRVTC